MASLARLLRVEPGERRAVGLVVLSMFAGSFGLTVGESGVSALFFERIGADALPAMYVAQGVLGFGAMLVLTAALGRIAPRRAYLLLPLAMTAIVVASRLIASVGAAWIYPAMWLIVTLAYLLQAVYAWGTAGLVTDIRSAKRLFPLFGAGAILGAVIGGLVTPPLANVVGAANLLWIWAAGLVAGTALSRLVLGRRSAARRPSRRRRRGGSSMRELAEGLGYVRHSSLLRWMAAGAVLFSVLFYSLYLPYAQAATRRFTDPDALAGFFGVFWGSVTAVSFLVSVLVANRLFGRFGAATLVMVQPVLYVGAFAILLGTAAFPVIVAVRFTANVWLQGVASPGWETLINAVPPTRRDQTRAFLNGGPAQAGTAIAGVVQIVGQQALSARELAAIGIVAAAVTAYVAWRIRGAYTGALVEALRAGRPSVLDAPLRAPVVQDRDAVAVRLALEAASDDDARVRRLAMHVLRVAEGDDVRAVATAAATDEDPGVRSGAIGLLSQDPHPEDAACLAAAVADPERDVRLAAVRGLAALGRPVTAAIGDPDPSVAAAAAALGSRYDATAAERLASMLSSGEADVRLAAVSALPLARERAPVDRAVGAALDPSPLVRAAALDALARLGHPASPATALERLRHDEDASVRRTAIDVLDGADRRSLEPDLRNVLALESAPAVETFELAAAVPADGEAPALLRDALLERARVHAIVALSVGALLSRDAEAVRVAVENIDADDAAQLANALETLDVAMEPDVARPLLRLWEAASAPTRDTDGWLDRAAAHDDALVRACAELVRRSGNEGGHMARGEHATMTTIELLLELRRVPLFGALAPSELERVARIAEERSFADGDALGVQGEAGDDLHIIVSGAVRVIADRDDGSIDIARRGPGDVVGEMSIVTREPRVASLVADGDVRTVRLARRQFESMLRERPELALAVMRVLAERLREASVHQADEAS